MVTSLKNLKNEVDSRLAGGGLSALACCQLQNAETILDNNIVTSVANTASLPSNTLNEGRFVYVEDIKEYRLANDASWTDDVSSGICVYQTQIFGWGKNQCGQLGDGTTACRCSPVREFCSATDWCQVSVSTRNDHIAAIKTSGELWAWGRNNCFTLGDGTSTDRCSPVREFCSATNWCQVSASGYRSMNAIKTSGELWGWGYNGNTNLGDGTSTHRCSPVREFCSATDWCQVGKGSIHTAAVKTSGELWVWGRNNCGQLGDGTITNKCSPVREFCSATNWCQVDASWCHTVAVKTDGQIWAWGANSTGRLGDGTATNRCSPVREFCSATDWCQVSAGQLHTAAIKTSGQIWSWGYGGSSGTLGVGTLTNSCSPVREFCSATNWCQVSAGNQFTAAVKTSGELWAWGINAQGRLGDGTITSRCSPVREISFATNWCQVSAGYQHTAAIKAVTKGFLE